MNPILFTTPRTGSTLICNLLADIFSKENLNEFFHFGVIPPVDYQRINNRVVTKYFENHINNPWGENLKEERLRRLDLIKGDYNYLIKIFGEPLETEILSEIKNNYNIIYLERKDKIKQILSFATVLNTKRSHYDNNHKKINSIIYKPEAAEVIVGHINMYKNFKSSFPSKYPTLYYEDFVELGANHFALTSLLKIPFNCKVLTNSNWLPKNSIPTPYAGDNIEKLILNKKTWLKDKENILEKLKD